MAHRGLRTSEITRGLAGLTALSRSASAQRYASSDVRVGLAATKMVESLQGGLARAESAFVAEKNLAFKLAPFRNLTATGDPRDAAGVITGSRRVAVEQRHLARLPPARITETVGAAAPRYRLDLESVADRLQGRGLVTESYRSLLGGYFPAPSFSPSAGRWAADALAASAFVASRANGRTSIERLAAEFGRDHSMRVFSDALGLRRHSPTLAGLHRDLVTASGLRAPHALLANELRRVIAIAPSFGASPPFDESRIPASSNSSTGRRGTSVRTGWA